MSAQERRSQLLDVLATIVLEEGWTAVSIDRIAREANIARTVVYAHFGNLEGMVQALIERTQQRALDSVRTVIPDLDFDDDPDNVLVDALRAFLAAVTEDPQTWQLVYFPSEGAPAALREHLEAAKEATLSLLIPIVERGLARRGGPQLDVELTARALLTAGDQAARLMLYEPERYPPERLIDFASALLRALRRE